MRLTFVVQRYGKEVNGGAEFLCKQVAEHLSKHYDVEVLTTCAKDYITWKNEYKEGLKKINNILVRRFKVEKKRDINKFNKLSEKIFNLKHTIKEEIEWMKLQGPYCPDLIEYIRKNKDNFDFLIFITYLFYPTYFGLPIVREKSILMPTAHNEPAANLKIFQDMFTLPSAFIYLTGEEKAFVNKAFETKSKIHKVISMGIDIPQIKNSFREKYKITTPFVLYIGRVDAMKCGNLFEYFIRYKKENSGNLKLVLMGKLTMHLPRHKDIISVGFVSEENKFAGIKESALVVLPSLYESLSIVILESWSYKKAVLVNGNCEVLKAHCLRSNGGLCYTNYDEFKECLNFLLEKREITERIGEQGFIYVKKNYNWNLIIKKYRRLISSIANSHKK